MEIHDNGKSFDVERVLTAGRTERLGLLGMRERIEMVGGTFDDRIGTGQGHDRPSADSVRRPRVAVRRIERMTAS